PAAARSVGGKAIPIDIAMTATAGPTTTSSFSCQPKPAADINTPSSPPITSPPGHQACSVFSFPAFSVGYSVAISGLTTVSTNPHPSPVISAPIQITLYTPAPEDSLSADTMMSAPAVKQTADNGSSKRIPT